MERRGLQVVEVANSMFLALARDVVGDPNREFEGRVVYHRTWK